jgi:hypothetical protein
MHHSPELKTQPPYIFLKNNVPASPSNPTNQQHIKQLRIGIYLLFQTHKGVSYT